MRAILLTSSVLILALVLLRTLLRGHISLRLQYALWLLVAVRLLVPFELGQSAFSILSLANQARETPAVQAIETVGELSLPAQSFEDAYAQVVEEYESQGIDVGSLTGSDREALDYEAQSRMAGPTLSQLLSTVGRWVYLAGVLVVAAWFLAANARFRRMLRRRAEAASVPGCPLPVFVVEGLPSPCLFGLLHPAIYLTPSCLQDPVRLRHVLAHELTHHRHKDTWWSLIRCACLCLYWFDPLVWWAAVLSRRDCELACDEGAIRRLGEEERLSYGRTLVDLVAVGASPTGLLQTATTMQSGKRSLRERVHLIARRPKMLAVTAVCLALALVLAVGCTFTGAQKSLRERLNTLPEETAEGAVDLAELVVLEDMDKLDEETLMVAYYAPDYDGEYGGWLLEVYEWDQASFEKYLCSGDNSGRYCFARSEDRYYAIQLPTDVNYTPEHQEEYASVQSALLEWVKDTVLSTDGIQAFDETDVNAIRNAPFYFTGNHMDAAYYPYYGVNGSRDVIWSLLLSQPVTQGDGGIWCVERLTYPDGTSSLVRPDTELPMADYYAQLQSQADAGEADWALDPMEVCLRFAHSMEGGHLSATEDSFSLGEIYSSLPGSANEQAAEALSALFGNDSDLVTFDLTVISSGISPTRSVTRAADDASLQSLEEALTAQFDWVDTHWTGPLYTDPWGDENLEYFFGIHDPNSTCSLSLYSSGPYLTLSVPGSSAIYQVTPKEGDTSLTAFVREWFDEAYASQEKTPYEEISLLLEEISQNSPALTLTTASGNGGGRYENTTVADSAGGSALYQAADPTYFTWSRSQESLPASPEPDYSLTVESGDGTRAIQVWSGSDLVRCTRENETFWLKAQSTGYDIFVPSIFQFLRFWYDTVEFQALEQDIVIPDQGQSRQEIAQAWADQYTQPHLDATPQGRYSYSYVRNVVEVRENAPEGWFTEEMLKTEHFYFTIACIFVPDNEYALNWGMAGNTTEYDDQYGQAPEGSCLCYFMGAMYLLEDGWHCNGVGTGP